MMVFQKPLSIQILQSDEIIGVDQVAGNLMSGVPPLVRHMLMSFREATDRFLTPPNASLSASVL